MPNRLNTRNYESNDVLKAAYGNDDPRAAFHPSYCYRWAHCKPLFTKQLPKGALQTIICKAATGGCTANHCAPQGPEGQRCSLNAAIKDCTAQNMALIRKRTPRNQITGNSQGLQAIYQGDL